MSRFGRFRNLFLRSRVDREIESEIRAHIEMRVEDNLAAGMAPDEARRDAMIRFGNRTAMKERATAADAAFSSAKGYGHNDFKIELGKRTLQRALLQVAALEI